MAKKNYWIALILSFFFGPLGVDRFYLGCIKSGIIKLVVFVSTYLVPLLMTLSGPALPFIGWLCPIIAGTGFLVWMGWWLADFILIALRKTLFLWCSSYYFPPLKASAFGFGKAFGKLKKPKKPKKS